MRGYWAINGAPILTAAGWMSVFAALAHFGCIVGGPDWYRFFGAGEGFAIAAERGRWIPHIYAAGIGTVLLVWAAYAFTVSNWVSGVGIQGRVPFPRLVLIGISAMLLARGTLIFVPDFWRPDLSLTFKYWSSGIVLVMGVLFAFGTWQAWDHLKQGPN